MGKNAINRILDVFYRAFKGEELSIKDLSIRYDVSSKTISRDIANIRNYLADNRDVFGDSEFSYNYHSKTYSLVLENFLVSKELMTIVKVLIGSRALSKLELVDMISKLKGLTSTGDHDLLGLLIQNEMHHYKDIHHDCESLINVVWQLIKIIDKKKEITITYYKQDRSLVDRKLKPIAILFSEYYFYLLAYKDSNIDSPQYFRIDRIINVIEHHATFHIEKRFDEGELRQGIQYMYPGIYRKIKFEFSGPSVQAILDKIPTAKIVERKEAISIIEAYVYGRGINMLLLSQGRWVKVIEPTEFVEEMKQEIIALAKQYE